MKTELFHSVKTWIALIIGIIMLVGMYTLIASHITPTTNDAILKSYIAKISPQVSGKITKIYVSNNQRVSSGTPLLQIDKQPYQIALHHAEAQLAAAHSQVQALKDKVQQAQNHVQQQADNLQLVQTHYQQINSLAQKGYISQVKLQDINNKLFDAKKALHNAKLQYQAAQHALGKGATKDNFHIKQAMAAVNKAKLDLHETVVKAPSNGTIINFHNTIGSYAAKGSAQMALVTHHQWTVFANIKENNLAKIKLNDTALISLTSYPNRILQGKVIGISNGVAGSDMIPDNYLPYIKKTHDWVRLPQRFPVQIDITPGKQLQGIIFRSRMSAKVTILTRKHSVWNSLARFALRLHSLMNYVS